MRAYRHANSCRATIGGMVKKATSKTTRPAIAEPESEGTTMMRPRVRNDHVAAIRAYARSKGINENAAICMAIAEFVERNEK